MDKYRPCPSIIAMFTSDSQHPPKSRHAVYLGVMGTKIFTILCSKKVILTSVHGLNLFSQEQQSISIAKAGIVCRYVCLSL